MFVLRLYIRNQLFLWKQLLPGDYLFPLPTLRIETNPFSVQNSLLNNVSGLAPAKRLMST